MAACQSCGSSLGGAQSLWSTSGSRSAVVADNCEVFNEVSVDSETATIAWSNDDPNGVESGSGCGLFCLAGGHLGWDYAVQNSGRWGITVGGKEVCMPKHVRGRFANGMVYARSGSGPRTLLSLPGGPGNVVPSGIALRMMFWHVKPLIDAGYTAWHVTRRQGMPVGHTIADMAEDYARLIADEFGGRVDLVVGDSFGGMIGIYLAANHPEVFDHIALVGVACEASPGSKQSNYDFAFRLSEGNPRAALAESIKADWSDWRFPGSGLLQGGLAGMFGAFMGRWGFGNTHEGFAEDVMIEAEAGMAFDARAVLPEISVPVLLIVGENDADFPMALVEETAGLIPACTLKAYEGKSHTQTFFDRQVGRDINAFIEGENLAAG